MSFKTPDYSAMYSKQIEESKAAREQAAAQAQEDMIFAREQASEERKELDERMAREAARTKKEEKARIQNLAEAEGSANETAEETAELTTSDRDQNFGNMFASLLRGSNGSQGGAAPSLNKIIRNLSGMRSPRARK